MTLAEIYGDGVLASYNGTCPICSRYVAANRSHILPIAVALPPDPSALTANRGNLIDGRGHAIRYREHAWIHAACSAQVPEDLELERDARRAELADMIRDSRPARSRKGRRS